MLISHAALAAPWLRAQETGASLANPGLPDYSDVLKRVPPRSPGQERASFQIHPGFDTQLIAAEPLVADPIAMCVDEFARLFVVEMRGYAENAEGRLGRVKLLRDDDGDGRMDRATVFLDGLSWPSAVFPWDGGVIVADAPDLLFARDTDGDDVADDVRVWFTGFYNDNPARVPNSLAWELDNKVHGASGTISASLEGLIRRPEQPESAAVNFGGYDFAIDPRAMTIERRTGGAQHGLTLDDWGRKLVCSNSDHAQQVMYEDRYLRRNPRLVAPPPRLSIALEGPQAQVFRISPVERWRVLRSRLRVEGKITGPIEAGGRAAGYFTSATGITVYKGDAWPASYRGQVFVADVGSNLVHRKALTFDDLAGEARRLDAAREFIASSDNWFRPVQFYNAPDGTLWVADMYREIIENIHTIAPEIKKHLDSSSGNDRGRLWRLAPKGFEPRPIPRLGDLTTPQLVEELKSPNAWRRETAARLIYQRQDSTAVDPLKRMAADSESPLGRLHAMYALHGLGALTSGVIEARLDDPHPQVVAHAVRLTERLDASESLKLEMLMSRRATLAPHAEPRVASQWSYTLGELDSRDPIAIVEPLLRHPESPWVRLAAFSSLRKDDLPTVLPWLVDVYRVQNPDASPDVFHEAAELAGAMGEGRSVAVALARVSDDHPRDAVALLRGLRQGARDRRPIETVVAEQGVAGADARVRRSLADASGVARDASQPVEVRQGAVEILALTDFGAARPVLIDAMGPNNPRELQGTAARVLGGFPDAGVGAELLEAWPMLSPGTRPIVIDALLARPERAEALLDRVEGGGFSASDLRPRDVDRLVKDRRTRARATRLLILEREARTRFQVVADYAKAIAPLTGDASRGRRVFAEACAACHRLEGVGAEIAPNLAAFAARGPEAILINVLDPNREIDPAYAAYLLRTRDGRAIAGVMSAETASGVVITSADGATHNVRRADIAELTSTGASFMPEGLEAAIDAQAMSDLIAYLMGFVE
ncbi:MAG: PVC-type heme-binding CxxCH protein [Planctomycetota bacterium]